jgi:Ca-activated chloride channel homolog
MKRAAMVALVAGMALAQQTDIRVDVNLVTIACSVSDRNGAPVSKLKREDFKLLDESRPREIKYFWQESELPLTVGLIADVSGSQTGYVSKHRQTIARFLEQVLGPEDRAFLVTVGPDVKLVTDLTGSIEELKAGVDQIEGGQRYGTQLGDSCLGHGPSPPRRGPFGRKGRRNFGCGGTALWNGVYAAARLKMKQVKGRKALIVLSDGMDTGSFHGLTDAIEAAQAADTLVYTIKYVNIPLMILAPPLAVAATASHGLERLSLETGGHAFTGQGAHPSEIFAKIENELRNVYVLGFTPPEEASDGKPRKIEIKLAQSGLLVRARKSYSLSRGVDGAVR